MPTLDGSTAPFRLSERRRSCGVLLHISSLPGPYGIGDLGPAAHAFAESLARAGQGLWQILPLGPTGYGNSPYQSFSTFAGNELLISPELLLQEGWLEPADLSHLPAFDPGRVDYGALIEWKMPLLRLAARRFLARADSGLGEAYRVFKEAQSAWLDDYALFMSIKECFDERARREGVFGAMWANYWPEELARGESAALAEWRRTRAGSIEERCALQFFFFRQFAALRTKTSALGLRLVGDMPIFVAYDSADVWGRRELFLLDQRGRPRSVAGVPPDYFSSEGQLWGNPLYDWPAHRASGYAWWKRRTAAALALCDIVRIDHFRGFQANWAVPYGRESAREGEWRAGPGAELFEALREDLGRDLPIIAEDLGIITPEVAELRQSLGLPGMRVLQFAFSVDAEGVLDTSNPFLPHNHTPDSFAYTGTHDNNTLRGWLDEEVGPPILAFIDEYLGLERDHRTTEARARALIRELFKSVAAWTILPMQDLLGLGSEARMNRPSTLGPINWSWRMCQEGIPDDVGAWLARLARLYGRDP